MFFIQEITSKLGGGNSNIFLKDFHPELWGK